MIHACVPWRLTAGGPTKAAVFTFGAVSAGNQCAGAWPDSVFDRYICRGAPFESAQPYNAADSNNCRAIPRYNTGARGFAYVNKDMTSLARAVRLNPTVIAVYASNWHGLAAGWVRNCGEPRGPSSPYVNHAGATRAHACGLMQLHVTSWHGTCNCASALTHALLLLLLCASACSFGDWLGWQRADEQWRELGLLADQEQLGHRLLQQRLHLGAQGLRRWHRALRHVHLPALDARHVMMSLLTCNLERRQSRVLLLRGRTCPRQQRA